MPNSSWTPVKRDSARSRPESDGTGSGTASEKGFEPLIVPHNKEQDRLPTLEDQLNAVGFGRFQLWVGFTTMLFVVGDGMEMAAVSMLSRALLYEWGVGWRMLAFLGSLVFAGYIVGNLWGGYCSDRFGRRWTLIAFGLVFLFGGFCSVVSYSFYVFAVSRFVTGIGIGAAAGSASSLMAECSPTMHRGKLTMAVTGLGTALGMALVAISGIICHNHAGGPEWWRIMLLSCILPTAVGLVCLFYVPESPHWCLVNGREDECEQLIRQLAQENGMEEHLLQGGKVFYRPPAGGEEERSVTKLFTDELQGPTTFITVIFASSCFAFCGHTYIYPIILQRVYGEELTSEYYDMMWASVAQMVAIIITATLIDNASYGRRFTLQLVFWTSFVLAGSVPYYTEVWNFKAVNVLLRSTLQVPQSLIWVYGGELLPTTHRAIGLAVCNSIGRIAAMGAPVISTACLAVRPLVPLPSTPHSPTESSASRRFLAPPAGPAFYHTKLPRIAIASCLNAAPLSALQVSMTALFSSFMIATFIGALACSIFDRETFGEYLAGYAHEASEVGDANLATPRRNVGTSPFHDQFSSARAGDDLWNRMCSVSVDEIDDGEDGSSHGGDEAGTRGRREVRQRGKWEGGGGGTTPRRVVEGKVSHETDGEDDAGQ